MWKIKLLGLLFVILLGFAIPAACKEPQGMLEENDNITFAEAKLPIAKETPVNGLSIQAIVTIPEVKASTGGFSVMQGGSLAARKGMVKPSKGNMFLKIIFDIYTDEKTDALWKDNISLVGADNILSKPLQLVKDHGTIFTVGYDGVEIKKGGNRISTIFEVKKGDPLKYHLKINENDYGTLKSLKH